MYRIAGEGVVPSSKFELPNAGADLTLDVKAGSSTQRTAGLVLGIAGVVTFIGANVYLIHASPALLSDGPPVSHTTTTAYFAAEGAGLLLGGVGLLLLLTSDTRVTSSSGAKFSNAPDCGLPRRRSAIAWTPRGLEF